MIHIENNSDEVSPVELVIDTGHDKLPLLIYPHTDPLRMARQLCYKNNLQYKLIPTIAQKIREMISQNFVQEDEEQTPCINKKSDYSRSYEQKENRERENRSTHHVSSYMRQSRNSQNPVSMNRGELMYERNIRLEELKKRHLESLEEQINDIKQKQLTFQPKINKLSSIIAEKLSSHNISVNERNQSKRMHKSMVYQAEKQKSIMSQCTFKPKINKQSSICETNRYQSLYLDNHHRQYKLNKLGKIKAAEHNFQPEINKISSVMVGAVCFEERLNRDIENRESRKNRREEVEKSKSKHRPITGRPPALRNLENLPVGDYLYRQTKRLPSSTPTEKLSYVDSKSEKIYQIKKVSIFQSIFDFLDQNQQGQISWRHDYSEILEPQLWRLIYPVMEEMTQMRVCLNKEQFINSLQQLWKTYSVVERNKILKLFKSYGERDKENNISKSVSYCDGSQINKRLKQSKLREATSKTKVRAFR